MSAPTACTCKHPAEVHTARRPAGACTACTQCDGLLRDRPHDWHRCRCMQFEPFTPAPRSAIEAEIAGDIEVLEPGPWYVLHSHTAEQPCGDICTRYPPRGAT